MSEAMPLPRLLFLSQCLPYPPTSGVTNRTYNILRQLSREFDVSLFAFSRRHHQPDEAAVRAGADALARFVRIGATARIGASVSRISKALVHCRSLAAGRPYTFYEYGSEALAAALRRHLADEGADIAHIDSLDLYRWTDELPTAPITCTHHSIESELLRLRAAPGYGRAWSADALLVDEGALAALVRERIPALLQPRTGP
jgi:polysaccharide biosynthesis protein PslH